MCVVISRQTPACTPAPAHTCVRNQLLPQPNACQDLLDPLYVRQMLTAIVCMCRVRNQPVCRNPPLAVASATKPVTTSTAAGSQFTCVASTKVQILTPVDLLHLLHLQQLRASLSRSLWPVSHTQRQRACTRNTLLHAHTLHTLRE